MSILLHACCGPCTIYPLQRLRQEGHEVVASFYNPNIHPFREWQRRKTSMRQLAAQENFDLLVHNEYGLRDYLRQVVNHEDQRCALCYEMRFAFIAKQAADLGFSGFTSTLLYSRYQQHELIKTIGQKFAKQYGLEFCYEDFRLGWQQGIDLAIKFDLYRQPYCGCIYSEQERYDKKLRKKGR